MKAPAARVLRVDLCHGIDVSDDVGAVRERQQPRALAEERVEIARIEPAAFPIDAPLLDREAIRGQSAPHAAVRLVILVRDDDLVARAQQLAEGLSEHVGVLRGGRTEVHFLRRHVQVPGKAAAGRIHPFSGFERSGIRVVGLHLEAAVVLDQALDHRAAGVRAAGVLEERKARQRGLGEGGELSPDEIEIEVAHHESSPDSLTPTVFESY